jgi:hypothetical protein
VAPDPELGPARCSRCGRNIVWALTDRDVRIALEEVNPWGTRGAWWVAGLEGEVLRARVVMAPPSGAERRRWAIHWPGGGGCPGQVGRPVLGVLPGGKGKRS